MKTEIVFRGFKGFDHLKDFVEDTLEHAIGKLNLGKIQEVKVIVGTTHSRRLGHPPTFSCEAIMKTHRQTLFTKKIDGEFQTSVRKCIKTLSKMLINSSRNQRDKRRRFDRHQSAYDINQTDLVA